MLGHSRVHAPALLGPGFGARMMLRKARSGGHTPSNVWRIKPAMQIGAPDVSACHAFCPHTGVIHNFVEWFDVTMGACQTHVDFVRRRFVRSASCHDLA